MTFSARPRRPTSVRSSACSTLRERSPAAIADAVPPISSSGRRPSRTSHRPSAMIAPSTTAVTTSSIRSSRSSVELDVRERGGEDEHRTVVLRDRRAHAVLTAALLARNREVAAPPRHPWSAPPAASPCRASPATARSRRGASRREGWRSRVAPSSERTCTNVPGGANRIPPPGPGRRRVWAVSSSVLSVRSSRNERSDEYVATSATRSPTAASATTASRSRARSDRRLPTATTLRACSPPGGPS